jgi:L-fuculose-phosphate aldolase
MIEFHPNVRNAICQIGELIWQRGLASGTDGNISARLSDHSILITPSGCCLGKMRPQDLVEIDMNGNRLSYNAKPSSEWWMHTTVYRQRPDVRAAVHAHPPMTIAFTVAGRPISQRALPEAILGFGRVPVTQYATPSTQEGAEVIAELIKRHDALVLDRHGSLTVGKSAEEAFYKLDKLEHAAMVMFYAQQLGGARDLPAAELRKLADHRAALGLGPAEDVDVPGG